jgi:hypothetical protein
VARQPSLILLSTILPGDGSIVVASMTSRATSETAAWAPSLPSWTLMQGDVIIVTDYSRHIHRSSTIAGRLFPKSDPSTV